MLIIRSFDINVHDALMMSTNSDGTVTGADYSLPSFSTPSGDPFGAAQTCPIRPAQAVPWLLVFEQNVFWFLPPAFSRLLVTLAVALTHLLYVCMTQLLGMLSLGSHSAVGLGLEQGQGHSQGQVCAIGSFLWRIAADPVGRSGDGDDCFSLVPQVLVSMLVLVFSALVTTCSVLYTEARRFHVLFIPALLLDMDQLTSPVTISSDRQELFYRTQAICCLYLPYAGVIAAIAIRSIIRTESVFLYYEYLRLFLARQLRSPLVQHEEGEILVKRKHSSLVAAVLNILYDFILICGEKARRFRRGFIDVHPEQQTSTTRNDIVFDMGHSPTKNSTSVPLTHHSVDFKDDGGEEEVGDCFDLKGSPVQYDPRLLLRVLWNFVRSKTSLSRLARMVYDWVHMRDCLVELQLCSQQHYFLVKLVCLRIFPCFVVLRLFLIHVPRHFMVPGSSPWKWTADGAFCEYFLLLFGEDSAQQAEWCSAEVISRMPVWLVVLIKTLKAILSPVGSFLSTCIFTLMILCLSN